MGKKQRKKRLKSLSDQLRGIIARCGMSRYEIAQKSGVDASQLHRFVNGTGRLTNDSLDKIGKVLKLRFVSDQEG